MDYSFVDSNDYGDWALTQKIDIDRANDTAAKVVNAQGGYITYEQAICCLCGKSFDEVIDYDVRIWKPKSSTIEEWIYPL